MSVTVREEVAKQGRRGGLGHFMSWCRHDRHTQNAFNIIIPSGELKAPHFLLTAASRWGQKRTLHHLGMAL